MKVDYYTKTGKKKTTKIDLDQKVFASKVNMKLLTQAIYVYQSRQRQANASTKNRGEVSGGGVKPWRQKGTGRARHGSIRSPIWKGGGVVFGPTNQRNYKKLLNRKMRKNAIRSAFSYMVKQHQVFVIEDFVPEKTIEVINIVKKMGLSDKKVTFVQIDEHGLYKCVKNIENIYVKRVGELSTYSILNGGNLIFIENSLDEISKLWGDLKTKVFDAETKKQKPKKKTSEKVAKKKVIKK